MINRHGKTNRFIFAILFCLKKLAVNIPSKPAFLLSKEILIHITNEFPQRIALNPPCTAITTSVYLVGICGSYSINTRLTT